MLDHLPFGGIAQELELHVGKSADEVVSARQRLLGHPDDPEAAIVGHDVPGSHRVDELRRHADPDDADGAFAAVQKSLEAGPEMVILGFRERLADHGLVLVRRNRQPAAPEVDKAEPLLLEVREGDEEGGGRLDHAGQVDESELADARLHGGHARDLRDIVDQAFRRSGQVGEQIAKTVALVIGSPGFGQRAVRADAQDQRRHPSRHHQGDGQRLRPQPQQIPQDLAMKGSHGALPTHGRGRLSLRVLADGNNLAVAEVNDAVRDVLDGSIMGDDQGRRAETRIRLDQRIKDPHAGLRIERTRRLVAEKHLRTLGNGTGDGDALLLTAGELRRKMAQTPFKPDERERILGPHRGARDFGDERHVLACGQARDKIVELEDETNVVAPIKREAALIESRELVVLKPGVARGGLIKTSDNVEERRFS